MVLEVGSIGNKLGLSISQDPSDGQLRGLGRVAFVDVRSSKKIRVTRSRQRSPFQTKYIYDVQTTSKTFSGGGSCQVGHATGQLDPG